MTGIARQEDARQVCADVMLMMIVALEVARGRDLYVLPLLREPPEAEMYAELPILMGRRE